MTKTDISIILALVLFPLAIAIQGIDFTDFGYWLSNYTLLYKYPESIGEFAYLNYLTLVLGNLAIKITPLSGAFNAALAYVIVVLTNLYLIFLSCRDHFKTSTLLFASLLSIIFLLQKTTHWISYNNLTALSNTLILFLCIKAFTHSDSKKYWTLIGVACALGFWIRFPNILNLSLAGITIFAVRERYVRNSFLCLGGFALVNLLMVGYLSLHGQLPYYYAGLDEAFHISSDPETNYESSKILTRFFRDFYLSSTFGALIVLMISVFAFLYNKYISSKIGWKKVLPTIFATWFFFYLFTNNGIQLLRLVGYRHEYTLLLTFLTLLILPELKKNKTLLLFFCLSVIIVFINPMGSDSGMKNFFNGAFPICVGLISFYWEKRPVLWGGRLNIPHYFLIVTLIVGSLISIINTYKFKRRDEGPRIESTHSAGRHFTGMFTSAARALTIIELEQAIDQYVKPNDLLLEYNNIPMIFYMTGAKPYLDSTWSHTYTSQKFINTFQNKINAGILPDIVIRPKFTGRSHGWPTRYRKPKEVDVLAINFANQWLKENSFQIVWENNYFEILKKN